MSRGRKPAAWGRSVFRMVVVSAAVLALALGLAASMTLQGLARHGEGIGALQARLHEQRHARRQGNSVARKVQREREVAARYARNRLTNPPAAPRGPTRPAGGAQRPPDLDTVIPPPKRRAPRARALRVDPFSRLPVCRGAMYVPCVAYNTTRGILTEIRHTSADTAPGSGWPYAVPVEVSDRCRGVLERGGYELEVSTRDGRPPAIEELVAGTAQLTFAASGDEGCFRFAVDAGGYDDTDSYTEQAAAGLPRTACDRDLKAMLDEQLGPPAPHSVDLWRQSQTDERTAVDVFPQPRPGLVRHLARRGGTVERGYWALPLELPVTCYKVSGVPLAEHPPGWKRTFLAVRQGDEPATVALGGAAVADGLSDSIVAGGGATARLFITDGWSFPAGDAAGPAVVDIRRIFAEALGAPPPPWRDAVSFDCPSCATVVLAPRPAAVNQRGDRVVQLAPLPTTHLRRHAAHAAAGDEPLRFAAALAIADTVTPSARVRVVGGEGAGEGAGGGTVLRYSALVKGGAELVVTLHGGAFFIQGSAALERAVARAFGRCFGRPGADRPDAVAVLNATSLRVTLGPRRHWRINVAKPAGPADPDAASDGHFVAALALPAAAGSAGLLQLADGASAACFAAEPGAAPDCFEPADAAPPVHPGVLVHQDVPAAGYDAFGFERRGLVFRWAVVGGGPSGVNGLARVLARRPPGAEAAVLWVDAGGFAGGRIARYRSVRSTQSCRHFSAFSDEFSFPRQTAGAGGAALRALRRADHRHCRLSLFGDALREVSDAVRSAVPSVAGRVVSLVKVRYPPPSADFAWKLRISTWPEPVFVTDGVVLALGAAPRSLAVHTALRVPAVAVEDALDFTSLRTRLLAVGVLPPRPGGATVAVFGGGSSALIVIQNLALIPEVVRVFRVLRPGTHPKKGAFVIDVFKTDGQP
eukprot:gene18509-28569_t